MTLQFQIWQVLNILHLNIKPFARQQSMMKSKKHMGRVMHLCALESKRMFNNYCMKQLHEEYYGQRKKWKLLLKYKTKNHFWFMNFIIEIDWGNELQVLAINRWLNQFEDHLARNCLMNNLKKLWMVRIWCFSVIFSLPVKTSWP